MCKNTDIANTFNPFKGLPADKLGTRRTAIEYDFGDSYKVQYHPEDHNLSDVSGYKEAHLNNGGKGLMSNYHEY
ncbi:hypothetical protein NUITMVA2_32600 [Aeromonas caviae]|nr:hypothetical protein NUITMVA2_32600 [Aeromonas caviae]